MADGSRRGQERCNVVRASGYLDEILFSVGSPAASRDSFPFQSRKIFTTRGERETCLALVSILAKGFGRGFESVSREGKKISLFFFFFFFLFEQVSSAREKGWRKIDDKND